MARELDAGLRRMAEMFETLREARATPGVRYETDDVVGVLALLSRGYTAAEISKSTYINTETIGRWLNIFMRGDIETFYPNIRERMAVFDMDVLPPNKRPRSRPMLAWQQGQTRLADRQNPYAANGRGNGHSDED